MFSSANLLISLPLNSTDLSSDDVELLQHVNIAYYIIAIKMGVPFWNNCLSISGLLSTQEVFQTGVCPKLVPSVRRNSADKTGKEDRHESREIHDHGQFAVGREEARYVTKNLALIQGATISPNKRRGFFVRKNRQMGHLESGSCVGLANL